MNVIKNKRDFIFGLVSTGLSLWLLLDDSIIRGFTIFQSKVYFAQAGAYIKIIAALMLLFSVILLIRSLRKAEPGSENAEKQPLDKLVIVAFAAMLVYLLLMDAIGFIINTIWLMSLITFMLRVREKQIDLKDKQAVLKSAGISIGYSVVLVLVLSFMFSNWLNVRLP